MSFVEREHVKRIKLYRNGDPNYPGRLFTVNKRWVHTWDAFLDSVTTHVKYQEAVRSIRTPTGGSRVKNLDDLQDATDYVAVGNGRFKKMGYLQLEENQKKLLTPRHINGEIKPVEHSRIQASGRIRKIPTDVVTIFVYSNGNVLEPARRVTLNHQMLRSWRIILDEVTEKVHLSSGAARRLYTMEGQIVVNSDALHSGQCYVAVGADIGGFKKLNYGTIKPAFISSPTVLRRNTKLEPIVYPARRRTRMSRTSSNQTGNLDNSLGGSTVSSNKSILNNRVSHPPRYRNKKKPDDGVFLAKPTQNKRNSEKQHSILDQVKDTTGNFKATSDRQETRGAKEVDDSKDTKVDLPIDHVDAEQVQEEEIHTEQPQNTNQNSSLQNGDHEEESQSPPFDTPRSDIDEFSSEQVQAANKIQRSYRRHLSRKQLRQADIRHDEIQKDNGAATVPENDEGNPEQTDPISEQSPRPREPTPTKSQSSSILDTVEESDHSVDRNQSAMSSQNADETAGITKENSTHSDAGSQTDDVSKPSTPKPDEPDESQGEVTDEKEAQSEQAEPSNSQSQSPTQTVQELTGSNGNLSETSTQTDNQSDPVSPRPDQPASETIDEPERSSSRDEDAQSAIVDDEAKSFASHISERSDTPEENEPDNQERPKSNNESPPLPEKIENEKKDESEDDTSVDQ